MAQLSPPRNISPGDFVVVVHDFDPRGEDELTLRRGEKIELVELDDEFGDGWFLGKHMATGQTGLFPGVYTSAAPKIAVRKLATEDVEDDRRPATLANNIETPPMSPTMEESTGEGHERTGEITPQASRHRGKSDPQDILISADLESSSQKEPRRSASSPLPSLATTIPRTVQDTFGSPLKGSDSPVMNETLSVIDEHITDLHSPHHSIVITNDRTLTDSASEYSNNVEHRLSYIRGHETDEEEDDESIEDQVRNWDHVRTAQHLLALGVEVKHCEIFEQQEISGDVLLEMGQEFLFMKEFDFGVMGRRLKTWHKIKAFQEDIKAFGRQPQGSAAGFYSTEPTFADTPERSLSRTGNSGPLLPRIPSLSERHSPPYLPRGSRSSIQPPRAMSALARDPPSSLSGRQKSGWESPSRPSGAVVRNLHLQRRHSSIDATSQPSGTLGQHVTTTHQKQGSLDVDWTMSAGMQRPVSRSGSAVDATREEAIPQQHFLEESNVSGNDLSIPLASRPDALDRGYFSGGEVESRRTRKVLRKRDITTEGANRSRTSVHAEDGVKTPSKKRHSRLSSTDSSPETTPHVPAAAMVYQNGTGKGRLRSSSDKPSQRTYPRIVTSLRASAGPTAFSPFVSISSHSGKSEGHSSGRSSPMNFHQIRHVAPKFRRVIGLRAASDGATENEKPPESTPPAILPVKESMPMSTETGSTTPSATSKSSDRHSTDGSGRTSDGLPSLSRQRMSRVSVKSKKATSAYIRGLEKKTPQQQMVGCDYSGWMKKKSSNLMTIWRPRLFVLRGRRLSYYYSENDTEERGLIDITAHRVLRADQDPITSFHATITGSRASPTSSIPDNGDPTVPEIALDAGIRPKMGPESPFIFKLIPPKSGSSRTVQFTRPATHFFQVDNVKEGRLWMAALMKATIERDLTRPVETTNKQKTISLKQAQAMNQRPPALMGPPDGDALHSDMKDEGNEPRADESKTNSSDGTTAPSATEPSLQDLSTAKEIEGFGISLTSLLTQSIS